MLADKLAWLLICAFFGYGQLFLGQELNRAVEFAPDSFVEAMAWIVEKATD